MCYILLKSLFWGLSDLGLPKSTLNEITVKNKSQSIMETMRIIYGIKSNKSKENIVLLNSAAILLTANCGKFV